MGLIIGLGGKSAGKAGASSYVVAWDGASEPDVSKIPAGVVVTYDGTSYTGTLAASKEAAGKIYLVSDGTGDEYYRYVVSGKRTVNQIPNAKRDEVIAMLEANGYVINDDGTVSKK